MDNIIRVSACVNAVNVGDTEKNLSAMIDLLNSIPYAGIDITVFPRLATVSPSSGSLLKNGLILSGFQETVSLFKEFSKRQGGYFIVGVVMWECGEATPSLAVFNDGELIAVTSENTAAPAVLGIGDMRALVYSGSFSDLVPGVNTAVNTHCDLLILPTYEPINAGETGEITALAESLSRSTGVSIMIVNGGANDTSYPYIYQGFTLIVENGTTLESTKSFSNSIYSTVDLDLDIIRSQKTKTRASINAPLLHSFPISDKYTSLLRTAVTNPFLPKETWAKSEYLSQLFEFQTQSLISRMKHTGIDNLVVGVSGGLDSTVALMVAINACDKLGLPRDNVHGITMPGPGTSERTYYNALALLEQLGVNMQDISIRSAVIQHLEDISHPGASTTDTTYENAQARERTQILLDIANMIHGLVVGSGDLSEEALGFSTFGGDHLASYNVNCCMTKTMLREMVSYIIDADLFVEIEGFLSDILETPVSPELLPPDENGEITQKTEDILGPYELHEFFLYYFIGYNLRPKKIFEYATIAFKDKFSDEFIKEKLSLFLRKFCYNQFKRSCAPDGASITKINLLGVNYSIPSDLNPTALLKDLE